MLTHTVMVGPAIQNTIVTQVNLVTTTGAVCLGVLLLRGEHARALRLLILRVSIFDKLDEVLLVRGEVDVLCLKEETFVFWLGIAVRC